MKILDIFIYLSVFNFMLLILVNIPMFSDTQVQPMQDAQIYSDWQEFGKQAGAKPSVADTIYLTFVGVFKVIPMIAQAVLNATILLPWFLERLFNLPTTHPIIVLFTSMVWINYGLGLLQIWLRTSFRQME